MGAYTIKSNGSKNDFLDKMGKFIMEEINRNPEFERKIYLRTGLSLQDLRDKIHDHKRFTLAEAFELTGYGNFTITISKEYR